MDNYLDLGKSFGGRWKHYVYPDAEDLLLKSLLVRRKIRHVRCEAIMRSEKTEYLLLYVKVLKKEEKQFLLALEDLKNKMLICGRWDYEAQSDGIISALEEGIREDLREGKRITLPSGKRARIDPARFLPEGKGLHTGGCATE